MGFRAHIQTKHIIEYAEGFGKFNWRQYSLGDLLSECIDPMELNISDNSGYKSEWEISRVGIQQALDYLDKNYDDDKTEIFKDYTVGDLREFLNECLNSANTEETSTYPDWVFITWF